MEEVNNIFSILLEIVKERDSIKRNQTIKMNTLNTFCEIQALFANFTVIHRPVGHAVCYVISLT